MEGLLMSAATGALKQVLEKLAVLMADEHKRFKQLRHEVQSLTDELAAMHTFLLKLSEEENADVQEKAWIKEVREMSYDIEDTLDEFMLCVDEKSASPKGFIDKLKNLVSLNKMKTHYQIAKTIEGLKVEVKKMGKRNERYKARDIILKTGNVAVDPRALVIFEDASKLVGIDGPKEELIKLLMDDRCVSPEQLMVISVVGYGGMGKTTLANRVYETLKGGFECRAFVSVSRNPKIIEILRSVLCQVNDKPHHNIETWDIQLVIRKIIDSLEDKRYHIVVDDIWDKDTWKTIKCAFPENTKGSRIITTTRKHDIAQSCCTSDGVGVYKMKHLCPKDSERLFLSRIFGCEAVCPPHLKDVSNNILRKCEGLPLAIIAISGLLANKPHVKDEWDRVCNSIGRELAKDPNVKSMVHILSLSYVDLPYHLKTWLLYLSIFPEDYTIDKLHLVRRWIAEGFIHSEGGQTLYEVGEKCFNELINRSLIQPWKISWYHEVKACRVHDIILDYIVSKAAEENFSTVSGVGNDWKLGSHDKIRRLSLHDYSQMNISLLTKLMLSHVRSLTVFKNSVQLSSLLDSRFLRVVDLEGCGKLQGSDLLSLVKLFQLKFLSLRGSQLSELPEEIGNLQYLETLIVVNTGLAELPASITRLTKLVYLAVGKHVRLPDGIGSITTLEVLKWVNVFKQSVNFIRDLGKLKQLRNLHLFFHHDSYQKNTAALGCDYMEYFSSSISSLCELCTHHLHSAYIDTDSRHVEYDFLLNSLHPAPCGFQKLVIKEFYMSSLPNRLSSFSSLQALVLHVKDFKKDDFLVLGGLPSLVYLRLVVHESFKGRVIISSGDGFQRLRSLDFGCTILVTFESGAMPKLQNLWVMFSAAETESANSGNLAFGVHHLHYLTSIRCTLHGDYSGQFTAVESIEKALCDHPGTLEFDARFTNRWMIEDNSVDVQAQRFIHNFYKQLMMERQSFLELKGLSPSFS